LGEIDLSGKVYGPFDFSGGYFEIKQDAAASLRTGSRKDVPKGSSVKFVVCFKDKNEASRLLAYVADKVENANIDLYIRDQDWRYMVSGIIAKPEALSKEVLDYLKYNYELTCYLFSPFSYARRPAGWKGSSLALPQSKGISNKKGHYASSFESLAVTCHYSGSHVTNLALAVGSASLILCNEALSEEIWELKGNEDRTLETYEDPITSGTQWGHDWTGSGTFDADHMELNNGQSAYCVLHGPRQASKPVTMTADLSLDSGGVTGEAYVEISPDGVAWEEVLDQDDFEAGLAEYKLRGTEYMRDIYVRLRCNSGTSGKYLNIGSIKFEVQRWIEYNAVPRVPAGASATATLSGSGSVDIDADFFARRLFL